MIAGLLLVACSQGVSPELTPPVLTLATPDRQAADPGATSVSLSLTDRGQPLIAWQTAFATGFRTFAADLNHSNAARWPSNTAAWPLAVSGYAGGGLVGWIDAAGIQLQRIDGRGESVATTVLVPGTEAAADLAVLGSTSGPAHLAWVDREGRLLTLHLGSLLAAREPAPGRQVATSAREPRLIKDDYGGATLLWLQPDGAWSATISPDGTPEPPTLLASGATQAATTGPWLAWSDGTACRMRATSAPPDQALTVAPVGCAHIEVASADGWIFASWEAGDTVLVQAWDPDRASWLGEPLLAPQPGDNQAGHAPTIAAHADRHGTTAVVAWLGPGGAPHARGLRLGPG